MSKLATALVACTLLSGASGLAAPITIFGTGVSVTNDVDDHYTITAGPTANPVVTGPASAPAYLSTSLGGGWVVDKAAASWISPAANASQSLPIDYYTYQTTFSLAGLDAATAQLSGSLAADDSVAIFLNGTQVLASAGNWTSITDFTISRSFVSGLNTLDLVVYNSGGATGIDMAIAGTANAATPEPSTYGMMAVGLVCMAAFLGRRATRARV